ncbi:MAG: hypothetical protein ING36_11330 [Burkholderiales bacterium]|nr:hypothetical protein [Burkholderiales bacterium]
MTHTALLQRITGTERIKIRRAGKSWVDERGIRYNTETGRRHMDSSNGIKLLLESIEEAKDDNERNL